MALIDIRYFNRNQLVTYTMSAQDATNLKNPAVPFFLVTYVKKEMSRCDDVTMRRCEKWLNEFRLRPGEGNAQDKSRVKKMGGNGVLSTVGRCQDAGPREDNANGTRKC